jgi:hypothetical protein
VQSAGARRGLSWFALAYALAMVVRYTWRMIAVPEARWFGGTIPIWFHFVLAAWVGLLAVKSNAKSHAA